MLDLNQVRIMPLIFLQFLDTWLSYCHPRFIPDWDVMAGERVAASPKIELLNALKDVERASEVLTVW